MTGETGFISQHHWFNDETPESVTDCTSAGSTAPMCASIRIFSMELGEDNMGKNIIPQDIVHTICIFRVFDKQCTNYKLCFSSS